MCICTYIMCVCATHLVVEHTPHAPHISIIIRFVLLHHHYDSSSSFLIIIICDSFSLPLSLSPPLYLSHTLPPSPPLSLSLLFHHHYNHFMYQALLHCAKNSMNSLKKRIGSKSITVNPHRSLRKQAMVRKPART